MRVFKKARNIRKQKTMAELKCTSALAGMLETVQNIKWLDLASTPRMQNKVSKDGNYEREDYRLKKRKK